MAEQSETRGRIAGSVTPERLMADTEEIARWVRLSGTEEERAAFDHVEKTLGDLGLRTMLHSARAYVSLPEGAELSVGGRDVPAITHSMAPPTPGGGLDLPLVYVRAGAPEDYAGRDVGGKSVLVDSIAIPGKARGGGPRHQVWGEFVSVAGGVGHAGQRGRDARRQDPGPPGLRGFGPLWARPGLWSTALAASGSGGSALVHRPGQRRRGGASRPSRTSP